MCGGHALHEHLETGAVGRHPRAREQLLLVVAGDAHEQIGRSPFTMSVAYAWSSSAAHRLFFASEPVGPRRLTGFFFATACVGGALGVRERSVERGGERLQQRRLDLREQGAQLRA